MILDLVQASSALQTGRVSVFSLLEWFEVRGFISREEERLEAEGLIPASCSSFHLRCEAIRERVLLNVL